MIISDDDNDDDVYKNLFHPCPQFTSDGCFNSPQVFFSVMFGAMQLGQAGPNFADIATAQGAAYQVFLVIDRVIELISCSIAWLVLVNMLHPLSVTASFDHLFDVLHVIWN